MSTRSLRAIGGLCVALSLGGTRALAGNKSVAIDSIPPGAQVEVNGSVACTTPCWLSVPAYYFGQKHTAFSAHGTEPYRIALTKQGYAPKTAELTTAPIHWSSLNGNNHFDYYLISSDHFTFQLDPADRPAVPSSPEPQISAPPPSPVIALASPPGVSPHQAIEYPESSLAVRGVATDSAGVLLVTVNGSTANMRPQNPQATEFWSDPLTLPPGNTPIEIVATNSSHMETTLAFTLHYAPKIAPVNPRALSKKEIVTLLQGDVPTARVADLVRERGVKFSPTIADLNEIRRAGGDDELIQAIQHSAPAN